MHNDLKILFWLLLLVTAILLIYAAVDMAFQALDTVSGSTYYKTVKSTYTQRPTDDDPDVKPDRNWRPRKEPLPFLGYAHQSVVYIITAILIIAMLGFLIVYLANRKREL